MKNKDHYLRASDTPAELKNRMLVELDQRAYQYEFFSESDFIYFTLGEWPQIQRKFESSVGINAEEIDQAWQKANHFSADK